MESIAPERVGLSSSRLARIDTAMQRFIEEGRLAGLVTLIARRGRIAQHKAYGMANIGPASGRAMHPDDLVCLWSMSKPVTAVAALALHEEGHFLLDDPISRYIPALKEMQVAVKQPDGSLRLEPAEREITFRHLLTHTSGLGYGGRQPSPGDPFATLYYESRAWQADTLAEFARRLPAAPLAFQPGTAWQYGMNFELLGALIETIAGMPFAEFMHERIFDPLGMEDTGFTVPAGKVDRLATTYTHDAPSAQGAPALVTDAAPPRVPGSDYRPYCLEWRIDSGGGGLVSTATDYARFAQMLLNGGALDGERILSRKTVELMTMNHLPPEMCPFVPASWPCRTGYGMGLGVRMVTDVAQTGALGSVGSFTWQGAAGTDFWVDPVEQLVGISLPQLRPGEYRAANEFRALAYQAITD